MTHLGHNQDPAQNRDLLGAGIEYINELLAELAKEPAAFWKANERLANDLVEQAVTDLELRYQHKLRQARQLFEQRFGNVHDEARTTQNRGSLGCTSVDPLVPGSTDDVSSLREVLPRRADASTPRTLAAGSALDSSAAGSASSG